MSRHVWYAIREGAEFSGMVRSVEPKPSPLLQGGLEIIITMTAKWQNSKGMDILRRNLRRKGCLPRKYRILRRFVTNFEGHSGQ